MEAYEVHSSRSFKRRSAQAAWLVVLVTCCLPGCNRSRTGQFPPVYPVKGEVFVGGKPAEGAVIAFHPKQRTEGPSSTSRGIADREGKFLLSTYVKNDGAPEGEYVVTVYWPERPLNPNGEGDQLPADKLGGRFASPVRSKLRARIGQQPVTLNRIDLTDSAVRQAHEFHIAPQGQ